MTIKKLIKGGVLIVSGTLIGSVANYLYNMLTGRLLGPEAYGSFTSLLSVMAIVSVPTLGIQTISAKFTSSYLAENKFGKIKNLLLSLHRRLWLIGFTVAVLIVILSQPISLFLKIDSVLPLIILSITFIIAFIIPITRGILQGLQSFFHLSLNTTLDSISRLMIGLVLIYAGLSLNGAIIGVVSGAVIAYVLSFLPIKHLFHHQIEKIDKKHILNYSLPTIVVIFCITALVNLDLIMAKHFLTPLQAGHYSALSTIAKIIFYFSGPIVSVMFPMISDLYEKKERHFHLLLTTFLAVFGASALILVIFNLGPIFVIKTLYGADFVDVWPFLSSMGLVMLLYGLSNVLINYFLSINQMKFVPILIFFTVLEIILLSFYNKSISQFVIVLMVTQVSLLITLLAIYFIYKWPVIVSKVKE